MLLLINLIISFLLRLKKLCYVMTYLILVWYIYRVILIIFTYSISSSNGGNLVVIFVLTRTTYKPVNVFWTRRFMLWAFLISFSIFSWFFCNLLAFFCRPFAVLIYQQLPKRCCELGETCFQNRGKDSICFCWFISIWCVIMLMFNMFSYFLFVITHVYILYYSA